MEVVDLPEADAPKDEILAQLFTISPEFLRRFALTNPGRSVREDFEFHDVKM
jgi:hypothetical protein